MRTLSLLMRALKFEIKRPVKCAWFRPLYAPRHTLLGRMGQVIW